LFGDLYIGQNSSRVVDLEACLLLICGVSEQQFSSASMHFIQAMFTGHVLLGLVFAHDTGLTLACNTKQLICYRPK